MGWEESSPSWALKWPIAFSKLVIYSSIGSRDRKKEGTDDATFCLSATERSVLLVKPTMAFLVALLFLLPLVGLLLLSDGFLVFAAFLVERPLPPVVQPISGSHEDGDARGELHDHCLQGGTE